MKLMRGEQLLVIKMCYDKYKWSVIILGLFFIGKDKQM